MQIQYKYKKQKLNEKSTFSVELSLCSFIIKRESSWFVSDWLEKTAKKKKSD